MLSASLSVPDDQHGFKGRTLNVTLRRRRILGSCSERTGSSTQRSGGFERLERCRPSPRQTDPACVVGGCQRDVHLGGGRRQVDSDTPITLLKRDYEKDKG